VVRRIPLAVAIALVVGCAQLAGIGDASDEPEQTADAGDAAVDSARPSVDASAADVATGPLVASIAFLCNGVALTRNACPDKRWEYDVAACLKATTRKVVLQNTGEFPVAFIARRSWSLQTFYVPNQPTDGTSGEIVGVIAPHEQRDLSSAFDGGIVLLVGSVHPFDAAALATPMHDEGRVAYKPVMLDAFPTNGQLFVAELTAPVDGSRCVDNSIVFKKL
jgi:hypothetical protein